MSVELRPSTDYPGRTSLEFKMHDDSNQTTRIELTDDDISSLTRQLDERDPVPATSYECPLHDNCDGGCGALYRGDDIDQAIRKVMSDHIQKQRNERCTCDWRPNYELDRFQHSPSAQHREHVAKVISAKVRDLL